MLNLMDIIVCSMLCMMIMITCIKFLLISNVKLTDANSMTAECCYWKIKFKWNHKSIKLTNMHMD